MRPIVNTEKRIFQITLGTAAVGGAALRIPIKCVQDPVASAPDEIPPGAVVKAAYVELWLLGDQQTVSTSSTIVYRTMGNSTAPTAAEMQDLNSWPGKKNILEMHQGLIGAADTNPVPFYRNWIKIPKGKQRFGIGDTLSISIKAISNDTEFCGVVIFKVQT